MKKTIIVLLFISICLIWQLIYYKEKFVINPKLEIKYKLPISVKSKNINVKTLTTNKINGKELKIGNITIDKEKLIALKQIPLIFKDEICLEDECIDYKKINIFNNFFPYGTIISFSGTKENIPEGWAICDGSKNTPDLTYKFILGGNKSDLTSETMSGGSHTIKLTENNIIHNHDIFIPKKGDDTKNLSDFYIESDNIINKIKQDSKNGYFIGRSENGKDDNTLPGEPHGSCEDNKDFKVKYRAPGLARKYYCYPEGSNPLKYFFKRAQGKAACSMYKKLKDDDVDKHKWGTINEGGGLRFVKDCDNGPKKKSDNPSGNESKGDDIISMPPFYKLIFIMRIIPEPNKEDEPYIDCENTSELDNNKTKFEILKEQLICHNKIPEIT